MTARGVRAGSDAVLAADGVSVRFGDLQALDGVSLELAPGEVLGLIGPNGAGKSTLVNTLVGVQRPTAGRIWFRGRDVTRLATHRRARMGLVRTFQNLEVFPSMTVIENLAVHDHAGMSIARSIAGGFGARRRARWRAQEILESFGLADRAHHVVSELSYADRKLVEIARGFAGPLDVLLLDEPVAGVAIEERVRVVEVVRQQLQRGVSAIVIEHDMGVVRRLCTRVAVLDAGVLISTGTFEHVSTDPRVREAYLG